MLPVYYESIPKKLKLSSVTSVKAVVLNEKGEIAMAVKDVGTEVSYALIGGKPEKKDKNLSSVLRREVRQEGGLIIRDIENKYLIRVGRDVFAVLEARLQAIDASLIEHTSKERQANLRVEFLDPVVAFRMVESKRGKDRVSRIRDEDVLMEYAFPE